MCDDDAEEVCYDEWSLPSHCAKIVDGGCHPSFDDVVSRGERTGFSGICVDVCCDKSESEDCYNDDGEKYCAKFTDYGCPCGDGYVRCHYEKRRIEPFPGLGYCEPASWCCVLQRRRGIVRLLRQQDKAIDKVLCTKNS